MDVAQRVKIHRRAARERNARHAGILNSHVNVKLCPDSQ